MIRPVVRSVVSAVVAAVCASVMWTVADRVSVALAQAQGQAAPQGAGRGRGAPPAPRTAQELAPIDLIGNWVAIVTEDYRWRMVTPPKGDVASIPINAEGRKATEAWDLSRDNAASLQCKAFGVGGIMRQPGRLRVSWENPTTLKLEFDAGTQTRLLHFGAAPAPTSAEAAAVKPAERTWQGHSVATWEGPGVGRGGELPPGNALAVARGGQVVVPGGGGQGLRGGPPPRGQASIVRGGSLKVVTTQFREGYLRKNGVPYSEQATITEHFHRLPPHPNGDEWLHVTTIVDDPRYLTQPFYTSTHFKREADGTKWNPTPCATAAPLPVVSRPRPAAK
jgi:hypothetical protein